MSSDTFIYTILPGDTLSKITNEINACCGVTLHDLTQANPNLNSNNLKVGELLNVPAIIKTRSGLRYTVQAGDDLDAIIQNINSRSGLTYQEVEKSNPSLLPSQMKIGEKITIPPTIPTSSPTPIQTTDRSIDIPNIGYWHWTYHHSTAPPNTSMGMAFFGAVDPATALKQSARVQSVLKGTKYICLGGGTNAGRYSAEAIQKIIAAINAGDFAEYQGIAFDVEVGDSGLAGDFENLFSVSTDKGFENLVTVSHSKPYGIHDGTTLMRSFLTNENIDFLSPQLYTTGKEPANQYIAYGVRWSEYAQAKAAVIPSIVNGSYYEDAVQYFALQGVTLQGYIQWQQYS